MGRQFVRAVHRLVRVMIEWPAPAVAVSTGLPSVWTRAFTALNAIGQHFGRPGTPTGQAWIETLFGHIKAECPHLLAIRDPATMRAELAIVRTHHNTVRMHEGIACVTPDDEHHGRGPAIRQSRRTGLENSRQRRLAFNRQTRHPRPAPGPGDVV